MKYHENGLKGSGDMERSEHKFKGKTFDLDFVSR